MTEDEELEYRLRKLIKVLPAAARTVHVSYGGEGDEGNIEAIDVTDGVCLTFDIGPGLWDEFADLVMGLVDSRFAGWENNDGASGEVSILIAEDGKIQVEIEHNTRIVDTSTETEELTFPAPSPTKTDAKKDES